MVRDQTLSRIKSNIELMITSGGKKAVIIPHSMGVLYFLHFMKWVEAPAPMGGGGSDWCAKHIKAVMNIGGPFLGVPKFVPGLLSAEVRDIAVLGKAQLALQKGEEDLAREALKRRKSNADNATALKAQFDQQKVVVESLVSNTRLLESKIQEAKSKKDTLKARAQSAKTATKVNEMLGSVNTSSALGAFEKMEEKVLAMESQAEALGQLTTDDLDGKFALLETSSVDDDLANLKKELSSSSKKGELPPGRAGTKTSSPFEDSEIEKELNELRQKARDS